MAAPEPPPAPNRRRPAWLAGLRRLLPGSADGDRIGAQIGSGAHDVTVGDVTVGKNIIQIGTLVIPVIPLIALVLVITAGVGFGIWRSRGPRLLPNPFDTNVFVAEFGQIDGRGAVQASSDGTNLSRWLADNLQRALTEYARLDPATNIRVWHDGTDLGFQIGRLSDQDQARALAEKFHARIIIFGNLDTRQEPAGFMPAFYVAPLRGIADEIVGTQALGAAIPVRLPLNPDQPSADVLARNLRVRSDALIQLAMSVAVSLTGDHKTALAMLRQVETGLPGWDESQGKEVLYWLIGRELLYLDQDQEAELYFERALKVQPTYARAHIGLGGVYHVRANRLAPEKRLDPPLDVDRAIAEYGQVLQTAAQAPGTQVELKARLGLATADRLKGEAYLFRGDYAAALPLYDASIASTQQALASIQDPQDPLLALGYSYLGEANQQKAYIARTRNDRPAGQALLLQARDDYDRCIKLAAPAPVDDLRTGYCEPYRRQVQAALDELTRNP